MVLRLGVRGCDRIGAGTGGGGREGAVGRKKGASCLHFHIVIALTKVFWGPIGSELALAVEAAKELEAAGKKARVVSMLSWEVFEEQVHTLPYPHPSTRLAMSCTHNSCRHMSDFTSA